MTNQVFDVDDPDPRAPSAYENRQAAELYRDARLWRENALALWAVRVLWAYGAENHGNTPRAIPNPADGGWAVFVGLVEYQGDTPEAATLEAAQALAPELGDKCPKRPARQP